MRQQMFVLAFAVSAPVLIAQNCQPPTHVATVDPLQFTHYLGGPGQDSANQQILPAWYSGALQLFDLATNGNITISRIDVSLSDDGASNWGPSYGFPLPNGLVGQTAALNVYAMPTTWLDASGGTANAYLRPGTPGSPWAQVGSGALTIAGGYGYSSALFATPFSLPTGSYGIAVEIAPVTSPVPGMPATYPPPYSLHPRLVSRPYAPAIPIEAGDQFVQFSNHRFMPDAFVAMVGVAGLGKNVIDIHYTPTASAAWFSAYGSGCYDRSNAFYQEFTPSSFDLAGRSFQLQPLASQYIVASIPNAIVPPTSPPLPDASSGAALGGDGATAPLPLGFTFPYPGGSTTDIKVTYNGFVLLDPANSGNQRTFFPSFGVHGFLHSPPLFAPLWGDHEWGATPGTVHLDFGPGGQPAYITWLDVEEWQNPGFPYTFQLVLHPSGAVEFHYDSRCAVTANPALVGFTPGWTAHDPGGADLSTPSPFLTGDGAIPPALTMDVRPILGTTPRLVASDLPPGAASFALIGLASRTPALDLSVIGMPGCFEHVDPLFAATLAPVASTVADFALGIPNNVTLIGARLYAQSVATSPGSNALGVTVSNALCIRLGLR